jgi:hypothetical protein
MSAGAAHGARERAAQYAKDRVMVVFADDRVQLLVNLVGL